MSAQTRLEEAKTDHDARGADRGAPRADHRPLWDLIFANIGYSAVLVAHQMGLFRRLAGGNRTATEIGAALGIARRPVEILLTTSVSLGLARVQDDRYSLTAEGEASLLESSPTYFGGFLDAMVANDGVFSFDAMKRAVLADAPQVYGGEALFASHEEQAALAAAFTHAMHGHSMAPALVWPDRIDLADARVLLDVGGGSGAHAIGAVQRWGNLSAIVLDIAPVCPVATDYVARHGLGGRIATHVADMWADPFPAADVHFYADIFHDWPDDRCRFLAEKSFTSLPSGGRIVLHELLNADDRTGPFAAAAYSAAMLLWTEGRQRSGREFGDMLVAAGFTAVEVHPTVGYWSIVTARRP